MTLLTLRGITKQAGAVVILENLEWTIHPKDRWGLVGANGTGKTTLLELVTGALEPDRGEVLRPNRLRMGYHRQIVDLEPGQTVLSTALASHPELLALEAEMESVERALETDPSPDRIERHSHLVGEYERLEGHKFRARAQEILAGLGFGSERFGQAVETLSGGEKVRLGLAKQLIVESDLLFLDEPTNHLDLQSIEWLERYLLGLEVPFVVVSHDRKFLDQVTEKTAFLEGGALRVLRAPYSKARQLYLTETEQAASANERLDSEIARHEEFVRRHMAGQKTKQAQSREKQIERLRAQRQSTLFPQDRQLVIQFESIDRLGNEVLRLENAQSEMDGRRLWADLNLVLSPGDRLGLLGPVGSGKSTLLKAIAGQVRLTAGQIHQGQTVRLGYHRQEAEDLPTAGEVIPLIQDCRPDWTHGSVRGYLARFGFSGDQAERRIENLSGGERNRLALARLLLGQANLLLLDEPTNHLDIAGRESLEDSLSRFPGAMILVSHDRVFLDQVATRLLVLDGRGGHAQFANRYSVHESEVGRLLLPPREDREKPKVRPKTPAAPSQPKVKRRHTYRELEEKIIAREEELSEIESAFTRPEVYTDAAKLSQLESRRAEIQAELESLEAEWETWA